MSWESLEKSSLTVDSFEAEAAHNDAFTLLPSHNETHTHSAVHALGVYKPFVTRHLEVENHRRSDVCVCVCLSLRFPMHSLSTATTVLLTARSVLSVGVCLFQALNAAWSPPSALTILAL